jgi:hypothetical protein
MLFSLPRLLIGVFLIGTTLSFTKIEPSAVQLVYTNCDRVPELNKKIISHVKTKIGKKVGRGECWDLAAEALNTVGANWDKNYAFGKEIDSAIECVYPGDIIQFEGVEVEYKKGTTTYYEELAHHTAIVFQVKDKGNFIMAEQNTSSAGKKVALNPLELKNIKKGKYTVYRPVK